MKIVKLQPNDYRALELILRYKSVNKTFLYKTLELSPAGITKMIRKLNKLNLIKEEQITNDVTRTAISLNGEYAYIIGVNFGAGFINIVLSDFAGNIIHKKTKNVHYKSNSKMINMLVTEILEVIEDNKDKKILAVGVSLNGIVDSEKGIAKFSPHIKLDEFKIREYLEIKIKKKVLIENDVRAMLIAEQLLGGYNPPLNNAVFLYIKNGIGSAILIDGKIHKGVSFTAAEIGHYIYDSHSNKLCKCGKYGCLETEFSDIAIIEKVNWQLKLLGKTYSVDSIQEVYEYANQQKEPFHTIVLKSAQQMGKIVSNIYKIIDIGQIIVAGEISCSGRKYLPHFQIGMNKMTADKISNNIELKGSRLGRNIENYGSVAIVLNNLFSNNKLVKI